MTTTLSGRTPLVLRTIDGEIRRTVAAIPTQTLGLYVYWNSQSYALASIQGQYFAAGWDRAADAVWAANGLHSITDWTTATRKTVEDLPLRTVRLIGQIISGRGGKFIATLPGTRQSAELQEARDELYELHEEIEADFFEPPSPAEAYRTIRDQRDAAQAELHRVMGAEGGAAR